MLKPAAKDIKKLIHTNLKESLTNHAIIRLTNWRTGFRSAPAKILIG